MLLLIRILPLMIGDLIPCSDSNWKCFITLTKIVDIIMSSFASADICAILKVLIEEHHRCFIALYTEAKVIPKFHFLLHYPEQILNVGPMVRTWNMRNEAKLNIFKQAARLGNFKNIAFSVANRHQRLLCYELASGHLLNSPNEYGPCNQPQPIESEPKHIQDTLALLLPGVNQDTRVSRPTMGESAGNDYKEGGICYQGFAKIIDILVLCDFVVLQVQHCVTEYFDDHYHAYAVLHSQNQSYIRFDDLSESTILHSHTKNDTLYIYLKKYFSVP